MMRRTLLGLSLLLFAACGDDSGADTSVDAAMDAPTDAPTDATDSAPDGGVEPLTWGPCDPPSRFECGTLVVPVDYDDPDGPTMSLAITRWLALSPTERIGVLVYGPGAGGSGVQEAQRLVRQVIPVMGEVTRRFDVIGFDIRGTAGSTPLIDCVDDATRESLISELRSAADDAAVDALVLAAIDGCRESVGIGTLAPFDMASTARDVDRLRTLLGEDTLSLLGISYGTWFATVYGVRFPDRVRAAVMASAMPASNDAFDRIEWFIRGGEIALTAFFDWCDVSPACTFRPAAGTTREAFDALAASIAATPLTSALGTLDISIFRQTVFRALYEEQYEDMAEAFEAAEMGNPAFMLAAAAMTAPGEGMEWHLVHRTLDDTLAPGAAIDDWRSRLTTLRSEAPSYGLLEDDRNLFIRAALSWTDPPSDPFAVTAIPTAPPFLFLAGQRDPVTPVEGALTLRDAFDNGSVLVQEQLVGHFTLDSVCGLGHANDYLLDPASLAGSPDLVPCPVVPVDETVVGTVSEAIGSDLSLNRAVETAVGDLVTDAIREASGADIAIINGGGMRAGLPAASVLPADTALRRASPGYASGPPYEIVFEDLRTIFPFGNRIVVETVTGAELHALFEFALAGYDTVRGSSGFVQLSGARVAFDPSASPTIQSLTLTDGTPIANDASATYSLAMPDYFWYGGTRYYAFAERATGAPTVGDAFEDIVRQYFVAHGDVVPATDGRIELR